MTRKAKIRLDKPAERILRSAYSVGYFDGYAALGGYREFETNKKWLAKRQKAEDRFIERLQE